MSTRVRSIFIAVAAMLLPMAASAQTGNAGLAGVVRDTSGAVLPGVTVEAASSALIEKVRTIVTDADGTYRILDLRPGVYSVTFSLPGFRSVRREGIHLDQRSDVPLIPCNALTFMPQAQFVPGLRLDGKGGTVHSAVFSPRPC